MILQIAMCCILLYPLIMSIKLCMEIWTGKGPGGTGSWMAGTLTKLFPKWIARIIPVLFCMGLMALMTLILLMRPTYE
jgi:hypothetical protein